jgi:two-component system, sensor histidine kinase and response regulator
MNILIVDDQPEFRLVLKRILSDYGWSIFTAEDGEDALETMAKVKIDFIISDIYMPVLDGFKLRDTIRSIPGYATLPIMFLSAYDDAYTVTAVQNPEYETFLIKTSTPEKIVEWVRFLSLPLGKRTRPPSSEANFGLPSSRYAFSV